MSRNKDVEVQHIHGNIAEWNKVYKILYEKVFSKVFYTAWGGERTPPNAASLDQLMILEFSCCYQTCTVFVGSDGNVVINPTDRILFPQLFRLMAEWQVRSLWVCTCTADLIVCTQWRPIWLLSMRATLVAQELNKGPGGKIDITVDNSIRTGWWINGGISFFPRTSSRGTVRQSSHYQVHLRMTINHWWT